MTDDRTHATTFLVSSTDPPVDGFFQGYCFSGTDYIYGHEGARIFRESTGRRITGGLDGCYISIRKYGNVYRFDTDYSGYKVLYYYHDGEMWAVSNSLAQTVEFLLHAGLPITPNYAHLAAIHGHGSGNSQLFSFETIIRGIRVLPRATTLVMTRNGVDVERWPAVEQRQYEAGLSQHLHTWVGRYETLALDSRTNLTVDVTGGVDSRTNFALALTAMRRLGGDGVQPRLSCGSTETNTEDLRVAKRLSTAFGLQLNDERRFRGYPLTPEESYKTLRDLSVGVYYPLYVPSEGPSPDKIAISGGGGEIHRRFYENHQRSKDPDKFFAAYARRTRYPWLGNELARDGRAAVEFAARPGNDLLRIHYREFRHRYHVGRLPRYAVAFTPLDSVTADLAQSQAGPERLDEGQFNYDVLASLVPELLDMPFDDPKKVPSASVRARLTKVDVPSEANPGRVWAPVPQERRVDRSASSRANQLHAALECAAENPFVLSFWGAEVIKSARELMARLVDGSGIGNAVNGQPISAVLAADLASPK